MTVKKSTSNLLIEQMKKKLAKQNLKKENEDSEENGEDSNEDDEGEEETREEVEEPEVPKFDKKGWNIQTYSHVYGIFRNND